MAEGFDAECVTADITAVHDLNLINVVGGQICSVTFCETPIRSEPLLAALLCMAWLVMKRRYGVCH